MPSAGPTTLGDLVRQLRTDRGLTQRELAEAAGFSVEVVARAEQGGTAWRELTAYSVLKALAKARPVSESDAFRFLSLSGLLDPEQPRLDDNTFLRLVGMGVLNVRLRGLSPEPEPGAAQSPHEDEVTAYRLLDRLVRHAGPSAALAALRGLLAGMGVPAAETPPASTEPAPAPVMVKPPVDYPAEGRTVQEFVPVNPPASGTAPRARRETRG